MSLHFYVLTSLCAIWVAFEVWLIIRDRSQGKGKTTKDRGTRHINFLSMLVGLTLAGFLSRTRPLVFPGGWSRTTFWVGFAIMLASLALRIWAIVVLGTSFRTTVETHENQHVVRTGPYKLLRHPSYTGLLFMCVGYSVAEQNWLSLVLAVGLPLAALLYRIRIEEAELVSSLGADYLKYQGETKKLVPWIW